MSNTPHDTFFARLCGRLDVAADQLRRLVPAELASRLDWSTLRLEPTVTRDDVGRELRSDLVFSVQGPNRRPLLLYVHLEHQRRHEPLMALRMLAYETRIWHGWCELETRRSGTPPRHLPPVVALVVYNGPAPWTAPTQFEDLIRPTEAVLALGPHQESSTSMPQTCGSGS